MMILKLFAFAAVFACTTGLAAQPPAEAWEIGPTIKGRNYSVGMPTTMREGDAGPWFNFPTRAQGHVHYVSLPVYPLGDARQILVRYRIEANAGTEFVAQESGGAGLFGLAVHRKGDNWTAKGRYEAYRWYSPKTLPLTLGEHTLSISLDDPNWVGVLRSTSASNPRGFQGALHNADKISMTFGGQGGRGHGVYATGRARFILLDFIVR